jgi:hypothetical protein
VGFKPTTGIFSWYFFSSAVCPLPFLVILIQIYYVVYAALFNAKSELAVYRFDESEEIVIGAKKAINLTACFASTIALHSTDKQQRYTRLKQRLLQLG